MLRNYIVTAFRSINRHSGHFAINVTGLSLGMAVFIFIFQFVQFESSYDNFHKGSPIYRVATKRYSHNELVTENAAAMPPLAPLLLENIPEVEKVTRIYNDGNCTISSVENGEIKLFDESKGYYADANFFEIFNFKLEEGTIEDALKGTRKIALSKSSARKYFGNDEAVLGKTLRVTGQIEIEYEVSAVYEDAPANSHFKPDMLFSFVTYLDVIHPEWPTRTNWIWNSFPTYLKTQGDPVVLQKKINDLAQATWGEQYRSRDVNFDFLLQPIKEIHTTSNFADELESGTSKTALNLLLVISIVTLIVAWINYINLTTARSLERAREVGVRKVIGASKLALAKQFLVEAVLINVVSIVLSFNLLLLLKDGLQAWLGIQFPFVLDQVMVAAVLILLLGGIGSSVYPAMVMSGFSITKVLKGKIDVSDRGLTMRKALVLTQFVVSPLLIGGTYLIYKQTEFMSTRDLGITRDQVLLMKEPRVQVGNMDSKYDRFKSSVEESARVQYASKISLLPGQPIDWFSPFQLYGDSTVDQYMNVNLSEYDFEKALDLEILAGRSFDPSAADSAHLVINEAAAKLWGYTPEQIIGRTFWWKYSPSVSRIDVTVIGVVKNYKQHAFNNEEVPIIYYLSRFTPAPFRARFLMARFNTTEGIGAGELGKEVDRIASLWSSSFPDDPFTYWFLDDAFEKNFQMETQLLKVINLFALIAVLIAGLGLFGLTSFTVVQRTKEVGIRKALGATVPNIVKLLTTEYFILILLAYVIALPIMWFGADYWLQNYEIKIGQDFTMLVVPFVGSMIIGVLSVSYKSVSAALRKPVETLRSE
ncbi:MAG: ABC transporter permease [Cyclobacteriaceae bacterium]|nr:ABC transporter permease [Cyclobacteriaceae bacterium]